jgi:hypothetical protein
MIEIGEVTVIDILLLIIGVLGSSGVGYFFIKRIKKNKNELYGNSAGGDMAGGDLNKAYKPQANEESSSNNILIGNTAGGDIAGGNINKDK